MAIIIPTKIEINANKTMTSEWIESDSFSSLFFLCKTKRQSKKNDEEEEEKTNYSAID